MPVFTKVIRAPGVLGCIEREGQEKELRYQLFKAFAELCRDLEHAGYLKVEDMARTGDDLKRLITITIPDAPDAGVA